MPMALATDREGGVAASPAAYTPGTFVRPSPSMTIGPGAGGSQPRPAERPLRWAAGGLDERRPAALGGPAGDLGPCEMAVLPGTPGVGLGPDPPPRGREQLAA